MAQSLEQLPETFRNDLRNLLDERGFLEEPEAQAPYLKEWRDRYQGKTPLVVKPKNTQELSHIVRLCNEHNIAMTPQGGNTGLVGGQIPFGNTILVNLSRMNRITDLDPDNNAVTAQAGVILAGLQSAADQADRFFAIRLASEGSCQVGGALSSNAGGLNVLRYGTAREQVLGLEVVLPDGRIWDGLRSLRKDNTGYDLKQLFLGAEGTLGFITAAVLKLHPKPRSKATAFCTVSNIDHAIHLLNLAKALSGDQVSSFELIPRIALDFIFKHKPETRDPLPTKAQWYVLFDLTSGHSTSLQGAIEKILGEAIEKGWVKDAVIASNEKQAEELWHLREIISEIQKYEGGSIKNDISVPISCFGLFIEEATKAVLKACPDIRPVPFGHIGDGNVHFNLSQPVGMDKGEFLEKWPVLTEITHQIAHKYGGSISAEHGIGVMKRDILPLFKSEIEMDMMKALKDVFDPKNLMNPGKLLQSSACETKK